MIQKTDGTIVANVINNRKIYFYVTNRNDEIMRCHYEGNFYEREELQIISKNFGDHGVFVDIGANVGNHTLYISQFTGALKVIPLEPNPVALAVLKINLLLNRCSNVDTRFLGIALAASDRRLQEKTPPANNLGHTEYVDDPGGNTLAVSGDALLLNEPIEFIKLDVEGMEMDILSGLHNTIARWRPRLFVEVWDERLPAFQSWCDKARYQVADQFRRYKAIQNYLVAPRA
jgi:FkbM family methyltransferase